MSDSLARAQRRLGPIDHVAVVVRSIDAALPAYRDLFGLEPTGPVIELPAQRARVCFVPTGEPPAARLELVQPTDRESGIARFLATRGEGLHHVCLRSDALDEDLARLAAADVALIDEHPRAGAEESRVAFIHPRSLSGVLWELREAGASDGG
ncbi:MAG: VOC family protein [Chloroflexota bacterium]|nr:VOC family protein [Chloroflexota bacterium]